MNKHSPLLLAASITALSTAITSSALSINTTIDVTTLADENGENPAACSLREAIKTNNDMTAFGGCYPGDRYLRNTIKLIKGTYPLDHGELLITRDVKIQGFNTGDYDKVDPLTTSRPLRSLPASIIDAAGKSRIINTSTADASISLSALVLQNGGNATLPERGGAILAGGVVSLENVSLKNNTATREGGAIYISGKNSTLNANSASFESNNAPVGAAFSMSCIDNLAYTARGIEFAQSAFIGNGDGTNKSVIEACGSPTLTMSTSTIAQNKAVSAAMKGAIVRFAQQDVKAGSFGLHYITAVENQTAPVFGIEGLGSFSLVASVIAFNTGSGCVDFATPSSTLINGDQNTLEGCPLPFRSDAQNSKIDGLGVNLSDELEPLDYYGGMTKNYLPKLSSKYILDKYSGGCAEGTDQRGSIRDTYLTCDLGSVERKQLTAVDDPNGFSKAGTDRLVQGSVLSNDVAPETATERHIFTKDYINDYELLTPTDSKCTVGDPKDISDANTIPYLKYNSNGIIRNDSCTYFIRKKAKAGEPAIDSNIATLTLQIDNKPPHAIDDLVILPTGIPAVTIDVLANDDDKDDGIYGALYCGRKVIPPSGGGLPVDDCSKEPGLNIRISEKPSLGYITAEYEGPCPDNSISSIQTCFGGKLTYHPNNSMSPFSDRFGYVVLDKDLAPSNIASVTIKNTAPEEGKTGGSLGITGGSASWLAIMVLGLLRRIRMRKIKS